MSVCIFFSFDGSLLFYYGAHSIHFQANTEFTYNFLHKCWRCFSQFVLHRTLITNCRLYLIQAAIIFWNEEKNGIKNSNNHSVLVSCVPGVESKFVKTLNMLVCSISGVSRYLSLCALFHIVRPLETPPLSPFCQPWGSLKWVELQNYGSIGTPLQLIVYPLMGHCSELKKCHKYYVFRIIFLCIFPVNLTRCFLLLNFCRKVGFFKSLFDPSNAF